MDSAYIDQHHVVDRYVMGKLTPDEQQAFELAFLDDSDLQDQVEYAMAMQAQLKLTGSRLEGNTTELKRGFFDFLARPAFGAAAAALAGVSLAVSVLLYQQLQQARQPLTAVAQEIWFEPVRGDAAQPVVVNLSDGPAIFSIEVGPHEADSYLLLLESERGERIVLSGLQPDDDFVLRVVVSALKPGRHDLRVITDAPGATGIEVARYTVDVVRSGH